ncbi:MAG: hypothetical protein LBJ90_01475 [Treponema sp.]|nr:hypothetical protein [Treponema sp.]
MLPAEGGLEEFRKNAGISIVSSPFLFETTREPEYLKPSVDADELPVPAVVLKSDDPAAEKPPGSSFNRQIAVPEKPKASFQAESPISEVVLERNGIHFINNRVFSPDKETEKNLDPDFRKLVDSVIKR